MSGIMDCNVTGVGSSGGIPLPAPSRPLHRLGIVRRLQGISRRTVARRLNIEVSAVRRQEEETSDILLSNLYQWQQVLEVPAAELLAEADDALSPPVLQRAQLVRLMKTALAIVERADQVSVRRMAQTLVDELTEMMPELVHITPWHAVGKRRRLDELGKAAKRSLPDDLFLDLQD